VSNAYPQPGDPAAASRFVADFMAKAGADSGATVPRGLLECLGGNSPYLAELALREPETLLAIMATGPDAVCDQALGALGRLEPGLARPKLAAALRHAKRAVALAAAVGDIGGQWNLAQVTGALTDLADGALRAVSGHLLLTAHARGEIRLPHPSAPERGSGFVVLAMGKLGARELNFSSDVDLILLYDPAAHPEPEPGPVFARMARDLTSLMEARDSGGYVFRVDLRLRPDPGSTPPCVSLPAALAYYEALGQTWERAALIKARPVAGDLALGRLFLEEVRPFVWRRYLDFAAMADIHAMKQRMDAHKGTRLGSGDGPAQLLGHDLKLGEGGIREIEFCAQTLQLVWAGRDPSLRMQATLAALRAEAAQSHLPEADLRALTGAYVFLRQAEHRLQMVADRQTHRLPTTPAGLELFAIFLGYASASAFAAAALPHLHAVRDIFAGLFASLPAASDEALPRMVTVPDGGAAHGFAPTAHACSCATCCRRSRRPLRGSRTRMPRRRGSTSSFTGCRPACRCCPCCSTIPRCWNAWRMFSARRLGWPITWRVFRRRWKGWRRRSRSRPNPPPRWRRGCGMRADWTTRWPLPAAWCGRRSSPFRRPSCLAGSMWMRRDCAAPRWPTRSSRRC
jgi:glutamate-ammonia-ligase adenylyltransferase